MPVLAQLLMVFAPFSFFWEIIQSSIVSIGPTLKTPKDSVLPLPSMLSLLERMTAPVAGGPSGTDPTTQQRSNSLGGDFLLSLLISSSYVIADGDLMGVSQDLHHRLCVPHPVI